MLDILLFSSYSLFYRRIGIVGLISCAAARSPNSTPIITIRRIRFGRLRGHLESLSLFFFYRTSVDSVETVGANAMTKVADDFS